MEDTFQVNDEVRLNDKWAHITEVRDDAIRIRFDGLSQNEFLICKNLFRRVAYKPDPIAKMGFCWVERMCE